MSNRKRLDVGQVAITHVPLDELTAEDLQQWSQLCAAQPDPGNPFLSPTWVLGWYRQYVPAADQQLLLIRHAGNPQLLGVAALYLQTMAFHGLQLARRLLPVGGGTSNTPFELPGILTAAGRSRDVMRALMAVTLQSGAHWCETSLAPGQGWFEPEWVFDTGRTVSFYEPRMAHACVVLPLHATWEETRTELKRNIKESIRRSHNRLKKETADYRVVHLQGETLDVAAVNRFLGLHRARSSAGQGSVHHHDAYAAPQARRLLRDVLPQLAREGRASLFELQCDGQTRASQLALHTEGCSYIHSSGFDPELWELGPVTLLQTALIKHAIERGDRIVNFSPGPNVSKLRWSEDIWVTQDFAYGAGDDRMRLRYCAYLTASALLSNLRAVDFARRNARLPAPRPTLPAAFAHKRGKPDAEASAEEPAAMEPRPSAPAIEPPAPSATAPRNDETLRAG